MFKMAAILKRFSKIFPSITENSIKNLLPGICVQIFLEPIQAFGCRYQVQLVYPHK